MSYTYLYLSLSEITEKKCVKKIPRTWQRKFELSKIARPCQQ